MFVSKGQESLQKGDKMIDREKLLSIRESLSGMKFSVVEDAGLCCKPLFEPCFREDIDRWIELQRHNNRCYEEMMAEEEAMEKMLLDLRCHSEEYLRISEERDFPVEIIYEDEESTDFCEWDPDDYECQQERYNQW
jgi:hypothetical protein